MHWPDQWRLAASSDPNTRTHACRAPPAELWRVRFSFPRLFFHSIHVGADNASICVAYESRSYIHIRLTVGGTNATRIIFFIFYIVYTTMLYCSSRSVIKTPERKKILHYTMFPWRVWRVYARRDLRLVRMAMVFPPNRFCDYSSIVQWSQTLRRPDAVVFMRILDFSFFMTISDVFTNCTGFVHWFFSTSSSVST